MNTPNEPYREYPPRSSGGKTVIIIAVIAVLAIIAAFAFGLVNVSGEPGKMPEVSVSGGQAPTVDVDTAKVSVGTKDSTVTVPKVSVGTTEESVKVPTVDVEKAK